MHIWHLLCGRCNAGTIRPRCPQWSGCGNHAFNLSTSLFYVEVWESWATEAHDVFFFAVDFCMLIVSHERKQAQTLRLKGQRDVLHRHFGLKCGLFFLSSASAPASFAVASHSGGSLPLSRYILALCSSPILQLLSCRTPSALTEWIEAQKDSLYNMTWMTFRRMSFFLHSTYEPHEAS